MHSVQLKHPISVGLMKASLWDSVPGLCHRCHHLEGTFRVTTKTFSSFTCKLLELANLSFGEEFHVCKEAITKRHFS